MRRLAGTLVIAASLILGMPGGAWAQASGPTLTMAPNCYQDADGSQVYGVDVGLTGFAPNTPFTGRLEGTYINPPVNPDGSYSTGFGIGPVPFTTDANGNFGPLTFGTVGVATIFTATVVYSGGTLTKTVTVTCRPTSKDQCKHEGWRSYPGFKDQGDCVRFVARLPAG
jgi:hypothetical protein